MWIKFYKGDIHSIHRNTFFYFFYFYFSLFFTLFQVISRRKWVRKRAIENKSESENQSKNKNENESERMER